jgi:alkylation response protein AidB-like acyl-CoA dehydrogenase
VWCQGFSEPNAGSDLASLQCRAVRDGDVYIVNGQKIWSSGAHRASWCLLLARTDPEAPKHRGISVFMLDLSSPGIEIRPIRQATGSAEFCEIFLTDVRIPVEHRLGTENDGWRIAQTTLSTERGSFIIENQVRLLEVLDKVAAEAATVELGNGRTAAQDPAVRQELAERAAEVEVLGMLADKIIGGLLRHGEMGPEGSILKLFYSETLQKLTGLAARIRGVAADVDPEVEGFGGYTSGNWLIDHIASWTWTIAAGSNEIQRNIIGERVLGLPREPALS